MRAHAYREYQSKQSWMNKQFFLHYWVQKKVKKKQAKAKRKKTEKEW